MKRQGSTTAYLIKERRAKLRMSQQDLANAIGVNKSTISRWESGQIEKVPIDFIQVLADVLKTSPEYLMGWDTKDDLSPEERLLKAFNAADEKTKSVIRTLLDIDN